MLNPRLLLAFVLIAVCLSVSSAGAHFVWLDAEKTGDNMVGLLFFSEGPQERDYHLPGPIAARRSSPARPMESGMS